MILILDSEGNIVIAGMTQSSNFPTINAHQPSKSSTSDAFVTKITQDGQSIIFSTFYGGNGIEELQGLDFDNQNNILVSGASASTDLEMRNAFQSTHGGGLLDCFIAKYNANGSLLFASYLGGSSEDFIADTCFDNEDNMIVTGRTTSDNFVTTDNVIQEESTTDSGDVFITKLTSNGSLVFSTLFGGDRDDCGRAITVDSNNNILFTGQSNSYLLPVTNANFSQSVYGGNRDSYLAIITPDGKELLFMTYIGGSIGSEFGWGVIMTNSDEVLVAGNTNAYDFPIVNGYQSELGGNQDNFICKYAPMQENSSSLEEDNVSNDISGFESGFLIVSLFTVVITINLKKKSSKD